MWRTVFVNYSLRWISLVPAAETSTAKIANTVLKKGKSAIPPLFN